MNPIRIAGDNELAVIEEVRTAGASGSDLKPTAKQRAALLRYIKRMRKVLDEEPKLELILDNIRKLQERFREESDPASQAEACEK